MAKTTKTGENLVPETIPVTAQVTQPDPATVVGPEHRSADGTNQIAQPADGARLEGGDAKGSYHVTIEAQKNGEFTPDQRLAAGINVPAQGGYTGPLSESQLKELKEDKYVKVEEAK